MTWVKNHGPDELYKKFRVWRVRAKVWLDEENPDEFVFTLRPEKDEHAVVALSSYANSSEHEYPNRARQIREHLNRIIKENKDG